MSNYQEHINAIRDARKKRDDARYELYASLIRNIQFKKEARKAAEGGDEVQPALSTHVGTEGGAASAIASANEKEAIYRRMEANVREHIIGLLRDRSPEAVIEEWNDDHPIMLLPIRVETKFKIEPPLKELWVRIFPDEIAIVTHEKTLTAHEEKMGMTYWKELLTAEIDTIKKKEAWRKLAEDLGANRAAWVARQTKPLNWHSQPAPVNTEALVFPAFDLVKPDAWTEAPHSRIMPDRFVLMAFDDRDQLLHSETGNYVKDILITGPAPVENGDKPSITRDENEKRIVFGDDFAWVKDFDKAIEQGLGFKVTLNDVIVNGFAKLLVIGLKMSADETDGKQLVEDLIDNHHYSRKGFSIVRQGSPTNNTEEADAAFNSKDPIQDISFFVETGDPLFSHADNKFRITDGQRLAEYLGIEYAPLQYIANSGLKEHAEAVAMNAALSAGTLDYFLDRMLNGVSTDRANQQIRTHFVNYVTGRGPLPSIRVGKQPYGMLVTSAFPLWKYAPRRPSRHSLLDADDILPRLLTILRYFEEKWKERISGIPVIGKGINAGASLMGILGLHPTSVEYFQRVAFSRDDVENKGLLMNDKYFRDVLDVSFQSSVVRAIMQDLGYDEKEADGSPKPVPMLLQLFYQRYHTRLDKLNLIDGLPLSESENVKPYDKTGTRHFIHWLIANAADHGKLEQLDFGGAEAPNSLLFLMLHYSLLLETGKSISNFLHLHDISAAELVKPKKMMNMSSAPSVSPWEIFKTPVNLLVGEEASGTPLYSYLHSARFDRPEFSGVVHNLKEHKEALEVLKDMSTASLERALAEHIDTLSYRLDSWIHSLFDVRLRSKRNISGDEASRRKGIYVGAYGYLENVVPSSKRQRISEEQLPERLRDNSGALYHEPANGGFVHAPSLNHATAAAILRNGYLSYASKDEKELLSVNLSSERVRRAMYLIEGVRNGQPIEVLLGYQFERGFHDFSTRPASPLILNHLIPFFRSAFPVKKTKIPQQGNITGPAEVTEDFHVVNGLAIVNTNDNFPIGLPGLPSLDADELSGIRSVKDDIANTLDAFHDVLVAESAYQLSLGNFDRAAAVVQALSNSSILPEIEVVNTPRGSDLSFTNRVVIHFNPSAVDTPWNLIPMTTRANVESSVNAWIGKLIGDPAKVLCKVTAMDDEGQPLTDGGGIIEDLVSLADLRIQPIDFVYMINKEHESGFSEMEIRVRHAFLTSKSLDDAIITKISFATKSLGASSAGDRSFADILPLCFHIRELITSSRPALARDYQSQSKKITASSADPDNIQVAEMVTRVQKVFDELDALVPLLDIAVTEAKTQRTLAAVNVLRMRLVTLANAGVVDAFPQSSVSLNDQLIDTLVAQGESVSKRFTEFSKQYDQKMLKVNDVETVASQKLQLLSELAKGMLGGDFVILPRFSLSNKGDVALAHQHQADLLKYSKDIKKIPFPVEEWLHTASLVRKKLRTFELLRIINDVTNTELFEYLPIQIPYRVKDNWLAVEYPATTVVYDDTIAIVQYLPQGFDPAGTLTGIVVDDWTEFIPKKEETTGISFHYNQPDSCPPQTVMIAVSPEDRGNWTWDNLVATVLNSFERAKLRAVEPDVVDKMPGITTLLPAIVAEFSTGANNVSLDYSYNVKEVYSQVKGIKINQ